MPDELVLVFEISGGTSIYMHSIDASEAVRLGDYTFESPSGKEVTAEERAAAMARARGVSSTPPPEMQTPEERAATRAAANAAAAGEAAPAPPPAPVAPPPAEHARPSAARRGE